MMEGRQVSHYRIIGRIGRGGMGVVYRAEDLTLGREVALKFLPEGLSGDAVSRERFLHEARSAAALNHPHICTVYEVSAEPPHPFIAMELLEGRTLGELIGERPLPTPQAIDIGLHVAAALEAAHGKGILHRDIKPANIFVTAGGLGKVLDFGLAKSTAPQAAPGGEDPTLAASELTVAGSTLGTIAYMSPEQARGQDLDARSDLFSLGLVLYEMVTGRQAFGGDTTAVVFDGILNRTPPAPSEFNTEVPAELERIIGKAIEKDRTLRYQTASELVADLRRLKRWTESGDAGAASTSGVTRTAGGPGWQSGTVRPDSGRTRGVGSRRWMFAAAGVLAAGALAAVAWLLNRPAEALGAGDLILIADFENGTGDAVFDGTLRQALAVKLDESPHVNVVADQRVRDGLRFMNQPADARLTPALARDLCQRLGLKAIMIGEIAPLGSTYVLTLAAENCQTGDVLAREQQTAASKEQVLPALGAAATALRARLGESLASIEGLDKPIEQATTSSLEALKAFSMGNERRSVGDREAIPFFRRAVELDSEFALAHARLGTVYANSGLGDLAKEHRTRAYELRDRVSERERLYILAHYYSTVSFEVDKALDTYEIWKQTYPNDPTPYNNTGIIYANRGEHERSLEAYKAALERDPMLRVAYGNAISKAAQLNRLDEAQALIERQVAALGETPATQFRRYELALRRPERVPTEPFVAALENTAMEVEMLALRSTELTYYGRWAEARRLGERRVALQRALGQDEPVALTFTNLAYAAAVLGDAAGARTYVDRILEMNPALDPRAVAALVLSGLGEAARARRIFKEDVEPRIPEVPGLRELLTTTFDALIDLDQGRPAAATARLDPLPLDGDVGPVVEALLARGAARHAVGRFDEAADDYRRVLARPEIGRTSGPSEPRARLGLARSLAAAGDTASARSEYEKLLEIWKDADDLPLVRDARAEHARLSSGK